VCACACVRACVCVCVFVRARACVLDGPGFPSPHLLDARSAHTWRVCASLGAFEPSERDSLCARQSVRETVCASVRVCACACVCVGALCACVCVCLCAPVQACVHEFKCLCVHKCVRSFLSVRTHFLHVCNYTCACLCLRISVCLRASVNSNACLWRVGGRVTVGRFVFSSLTQMITDFVFVPHTSLHFCFYSCMCKRDRKCGLEREREERAR
jgi:hypothetical protein